MFQLDDLNSCPPDAFAAALGEIFEQSPWVAEAATPRRPFPTVAALHDAMMAVIRAAPTDRKLAFLRAHPELVTPVECGDVGRPDDIDTPEDLARVRGEFRSP